jgi:hypothetical protein
VAGEPDQAAFAGLFRRLERLQCAARTQNSIDVILAIDGQHLPEIDIVGLQEAERGVAQPDRPTSNAERFQNVLTKCPTGRTVQLWSRCDKPSERCGDLNLVHDRVGVVPPPEDVRLTGNRSCRYCGVPEHIEPPCVDRTGVHAEDKDLFWRPILLFDPS